ncbi:MAG: ABC transporter permease [Acidobacteriia bacterium]|nr:ABC transporter permease [Terriglobia bacterium]
MGWSRYVRRSRWDDERAREIQSYIEIETDENIARGMSPEDARRAAHRKFGNVTCVREEIYRMNTIGFIETLWHDLRYAFRSLLRSPGFSAAAVIMLTLGIGANTTIFSVADAAVFRPWPYRDPDRLVEIYQMIVRSPAKPVFMQGMRHSQWLDWRTQKQIFSGVEAMSRARRMALGSTGEKDAISVKCISPGMIDLLGIPLRLGRGFRPEEGQPGKDFVLLLSEALWARSFGADPDVVGKTVSLGDRFYTIVGVVPRDRQYLLDTNVEAWIPLVDRPGGDKYSNSTFIDVIARIRPGLTLKRAQREAEAAFKGFKGWPAQDTAMLHQINSPLGGETWTALFALMAAVCFLLLIACANIANLLLSRATTRQRETAIRAAIGASRFRLMRQFLGESLVLSLIGTLMALLLSWWGIRLIPRNLLTNLGFITVYDTELNGRVLLFTAAATILTALLCGIMPALRATNGGLINGLKGIDRLAGGTAAGKKLQYLLQVPQVALTIVLLCGTGLLANSFARLIWSDPGFNTKGLIKIDFSLPRPAGWKQIIVDFDHPPSKIPIDRAGLNQQEALLNQLKARVLSLPGVQTATIGLGVPPTTSSGSMFVPEESAAGADRFVRSGDLHMVRVDPDFFPTMGLKIVAGRNFNSQDQADSPPVAIIDRRTAELGWPGQSAIGKRFQGFQKWLTVIGVAEPVKTQGSVHSEVVCLAYVPLLQDSPIMDANLVIRSVGDRRHDLPAIQALISAAAPKSKIKKVATFDELYAEIAATQKRTPAIYLLLMSIFAATALLTAAVGIFGVLSYSVSRRTSEIGIRVAMGAESRDIRRLVMRAMLPPVLGGITAGLIGAFWLTQFLRALLYQVKPYDPLTVILAAALMLLVALAAALLPARRASRIDPIAALRME